ncbi:MAG: metallophosphoesterase, partial [Bacteroidales bacterium]
MRVSLFISLIVLVVNVLADIYIIYRLPQSFRSGLRRIAVWAVNATVYVLFVTLIIFVYMKRFELLADYLEIIMLAFFMICLPKIVFLIFSSLDFIPLLFRAVRFRIFTPFAAVVAIVLPFMLFYGVLSVRKNIVYNNVDIVSTRLPCGFDGYKIVQISDLHLKTMYGDTALLARLVYSVNLLNPDLICFTGDMVTLRTDEMYPYVQQLSRLYAVDGVYSVLGNHDYGDYVKWSSRECKERNMQEFIRLNTKMGWRILRNENANIVSERDTISLIGVENWGRHPSSRYGNLDVSYGYLFDSRYKILLSHNPEYWDTVLCRSNIDLTLSGHTHAMQIKMRIGDHYYSPAAFVSDRWGGKYTSGNRTLYVNEGIGCTLFPLRLGAYPE